MQKVLSFVKSPVFLAGLAVGAVLVTAYSFLRNPVKKVAGFLPKNDVGA